MENNLKTIQDFQEKIDACLSTTQDEPLLCIGYYLSDVIIKDKAPTRN
jgi:hypothetical protein